MSNMLFILELCYIKSRTTVTEQLLRYLCHVTISVLNSENHEQGK